MRKAIEESLTRRNESPQSLIPWTLTDWVLAACVEKLNHGERSRRTKRKVKIVEDDCGGSVRKRLEWTEVDAKTPGHDAETEKTPVQIDTPPPA